MPADSWEPYAQGPYHGRIIERGSHDELIAQKGEYYQLYTGAVELE